MREGRGLGEGVDGARVLLLTLVARPATTNSREFGGSSMSRDMAMSLFTLHWGAASNRSSGCPPSPFIPGSGPSLGHRGRWGHPSCTAGGEGCTAHSRTVCRIPTLNEHASPLFTPCMSNCCCGGVLERRARRFAGHYGKA